MAIWHLKKYRIFQKTKQIFTFRKTKINKAIERLESIVKAQKGEDDTQYSSLDLTDNDDNHQEESKE